MTTEPEQPQDPQPQPAKKPTWWERIDQWFRKKKPA